MNQCVRGPRGCGRCDAPLPFDFTMAFQPIVDLAQARVTTFEALVRGPGGESAWSVISQVTDDLLYRFDQACRVRAIEIASRLGMQERLSINFLPNAVYEPEACIQATLEASHRVGWPTERIVFEFTETERVTDQAHLKHIIGSYRRMGFTTALDDFGNGYANLDLLTVLEPDKIKVDRKLIMGCDEDPRRQALLRSIKGLARELELEVIAEGVETREEALWLGRAGLTRQQGFFYARPQVESLGEDLAPMLAALQTELHAETAS
ncbi:EAL domain, c-di-GMP-specific phosphodiesterase class I (or its enzymatically inactive variant) [Halomonas shengliensis]|uniref:EAL domain, c-di-GMP-specific phosphodiesterase class I (Or its enzymatically inactive variant) n=1 Tax=Halomonas shengliensis TaxID=419597 RepID=A0A1H0F3C7_9GAMM|nr:EAL domain-containing protein [Halomonas shengliensis]SDN89164.1 EAL domain, c-di-GMP-specific phosphodiesterase class I (or its enzymatically inactive variant) [Halomonas shengliensis]